MLGLSGRLYELCKVFAAASHTVENSKGFIPVSKGWGGRGGGGLSYCLPLTLLVFQVAHHMTLQCSAVYAEWLHLDSCAYSTSTEEVCCSRSLWTSSSVFCVVEGQHSYLPRILLTVLTLQKQHSYQELRTQVQTT